MIIRKIGFSQNNQADHIFLISKQNKQQFQKQIVATLSMKQLMHYSINHVIANCEHSQNLYLHLNYSTPKHLQGY